MLCLAGQENIFSHIPPFITEGSALILITIKVSPVIGAHGYKGGDWVVLRDPILSLLLLIRLELKFKLAFPFKISETFRSFCSEHYALSASQPTCRINIVISCLALQAIFKACLVLRSQIWSNYL